MLMSEADGSIHLRTNLVSLKAKGEVFIHCNKSAS